MYQLQPAACSEITALVQVALGTYRQFDGGERHASIHGRPNIDTIIMLSSFLSSSSCCWTHGLLPALPFLFCVCLTTYGCSVCSAGPFLRLVTRSAASSRQPDNGDRVPSLLLSFLRLTRGKVFSSLSFILVLGTVGVRRLVSMHSSGYLAPGLQQQYIYREKTSVAAATGAWGEVGFDPDRTTTTLHYTTLFLHSADPSPGGEANIVWAFSRCGQVLQTARSL